MGEKSVEAIVGGGEAGGKARSRRASGEGFLRATTASLSSSLSGSSRLALRTCFEALAALRTLSHRCDSAAVRSQAMSHRFSSLSASTTARRS